MLISAFVVYRKKSQAVLPNSLSYLVVGGAGAGPAFGGRHGPEFKSSPEASQETQTPGVSSRCRRVLVAEEGFSAGEAGAAYCWGSCVSAGGPGAV